MRLMLTVVDPVKGVSADVVVDADPTVDVANLKKISRVMLGGTLIDREALLQDRR